MVKETSLALYAMARDLIALRRQSPMDPESDPTSALLAARLDGDPLPDEMIIGCVRQVLVVGIIAPTVVIGSIGVHLSRHPELQQELRENPALVPATLEEFLRLYTPYRGFARTPSRDIEVHGCPIRKDQPIALLYASANRDEAGRASRPVHLEPAEHGRERRLWARAASLSRRCAGAAGVARGAGRASGPHPPLPGRRSG